MDSVSGKEAETEPEPGVIKKVLRIPCMRDSLLYGMSGGLAVGLTHFLLTSNVYRATNYGFGGYLVILYGTWVVCRYSYAQARSKAAQHDKAVENRTGNPSIQLVDPKDV